MRLRPAGLIHRGLGPLPGGWAELEQSLAPLTTHPSRSPEIFRAQIHDLVGTPLGRRIAHRAVHAAVMALAVGRWGRHGGKTITTDRVQRAVSDIEDILRERGADPSFSASFARFALLVKRALDHSGPLGLFGPTSIYGPIDDHPMSPASIIAKLAHGNRWLLAEEMRPLHPTNVDLVKATGEHHFELLPGNLLPFVGPASALYWMLGAAGHNGPLDLSRPVEGGAWRDHFGRAVTKITTKNLDGSVAETPLFEMYGEETATSADAFFGVEGAAPHGDVDAYRFENKATQWVTAGASQVEPGQRFEIELVRIDPSGETLVDRSTGIVGPAGIHAELTAGTYEVRIRQLASDGRRPEILEHPVGKRLGPALMGLRRTFSDKAEDHRDRYRLFVSGSGPVDVERFGPPDRSMNDAALQSSAIQEQVLIQSVLGMEAALLTLDWLTPMRSIVPPDDDSPISKTDPWIDRYMRAASRLSAAFYRKHALPY